MKRFALLALCALPFAAVAQSPSYPVRVDVQAPSRTFALKWAAGSSPILSAYVSEGGRAYTNLTGWTGYVYVAVTPTAGVFVTASPASSNRVNFAFAAAQTATVGTFAVEIVLGNGTNTYRWGTGSLTLSNSPALMGAGTVPLTGVFNWDLFSFTGTPPPLSASYTNALAGDVTGTPDATEIAADAVGTNELDSEVRGLLATGSGINTNSAAWTSLVATVTAKPNQGGNITGRWFAVGSVVTGANAWVGGGVGNTNSGGLGTIGGGEANAQYGGWGTIGGGGENVQSGWYGTIGGGQLNAQPGYYGTIGGGYANAQSGGWGTIGGGTENAQSGDYGTIGGGVNNTNRGGGATIGGGNANDITTNSLDATIAGGLGNRITGVGGAVPGGYYNTATSYAFAAGYGAKATNTGSFVWAGLGDTNATFGSLGENTFNVKSVGGVYMRAPFIRLQGGDGTTLAEFGTNTLTIGGYTLTDFVFASSLTNYLRFSTGAVTSHNASGVRGEFRRSTTNVYLHDGAQWVTWSVVTNF
jgi:hypothetical protein